MRSTHEPSVHESVYVFKGDASPDAIAHSLQTLLPTRRQPIARQQVSVLDTFDGRVRRAGARLTRAGENGVSEMVWRPRGGRGDVAARLTGPVSFAWDLPDGPLRQALTPVIGVRRLLAQADAEEHGSQLDVLDERGKTVTRVRIESGQVRSPAHSRWQPLPTIVTLTALRGYEDVYARLVPVIESRPDVSACPEGVHAFVLRHAGAPEPADGSLPHVDLPFTVRADVGARQIHRALLSLLAINEPGLRANLDSEFLHDFRVTVRRTRSLLGQIKRVFPADAVEHFSTEFSWLGRLTGTPRDVDVLVLALRAHQWVAPGEDSDTLMAFLASAQEQEYRMLVEALDSPRYRQLLSGWEAFLSRSSAAEPEAENSDRPLAAVVARRAWRLSRRIARSARTVGEHTAAKALHAIRIDAKKLRYLIDVTPHFYASADLDDILGALKKLQRVLGDFNDAEVQEARLIECGRALGAAGGRPGALLQLGRLAEQCRYRREHLRGSVIDRLTRFGARSTRAACRRVFKHAMFAEPGRPIPAR
jgi:CHAD domain-containing protein